MCVCVCGGGGGGSRLVPFQIPFSPHRSIPWGGVIGKVTSDPAFCSRKPVTLRGLDPSCQGDVSHPPPPTHTPACMHMHTRAHLSLVVAATVSCLEKSVVSDPCGVINCSQGGDDVCIVCVCLGVRVEKGSGIRKGCDNTWFVLYPRAEDDRVSCRCL